MNKTIYYIMLCASLLTFTAACNSNNKLPEMRETFSYRDTRPFGGSVAFDIVKNAYPSAPPEIVKNELADNYEWDADTSSIYFNISPNFITTPEEASFLLDFTYKGNTTFICASYIDTALLNRLYCAERHFTTAYDTLRRTDLRYTNELTLYKDSFNYFYYPFRNFFSKTNNSYARVIGRNESGDPNFFVFLWGKGRIFFHCEPRAFSNYFLLTKNNYRYMEEVLRMMPGTPDNVYWDIHKAATAYRRSKENTKDFSTLSAIMASPALASAFFIVLFLLLLYIFFNSKRRQRVIPVLKPAENTTIAFAEAMAGLYLNKKDNKLIAEKMITYFNEHIRNKYFLQGNVQDKSFAETLSRKSGVSVDITVQLTDAMRQVQVSEKVSDAQLLVLNGLFEKFFKIKYNGRYSFSGEQPGERAQCENAGDKGRDQ